MRKAFKFRLYPNKEQERKLFWTLTRCRELYNAALSERKDSYQTHMRVHRYQNEQGQWIIAEMLANQKVNDVSYHQQKRDLVEIKELREEYTEIASHVLQDVMMRLDKAFQNFFRRVKNGETPGYPRFQGRNRYSSFTSPDGAGWKLDGGKLRLSKIGTVKIKLHREIEGTIKTATVKHESGQWYVIFSCELTEAEKLPVSYEDVGIDLGVSHLATLSNGETIDDPRFFRKAEKQLARRQQAWSRKKRGSHRRDKARKLVAKAHRKIRNQRRDFLHKASRQLVTRYQLIVFEDIQSANLTKAPKPKQDETGAYVPNGASAKGGLNKSILDAGWGMLVAMTTYKAAWAGREVRTVNPRYTSQICSGCGTVRKKELSERWHSCDCGTELDRDHNAAINIKRLGTSQQG
jgi:putative transposase